MSTSEFEKTQQMLNQQTEHYDAATLSKLRQAREQALQAYDDKQSGGFWARLPVPLPALGGFATAAAVALGLLFVNSQQHDIHFSDEQLQVVNEILLEDSLGNALLSEGVDIEFYENIEFYEWLERSNEANSG